MSSWDPTPRGVVMSLSRNDFAREFRDYGRENQFSRDALDVLHEYYEQLSECTGEPFAIDVIGICCDWSELTEEEVLEHYDVEDLDELDVGCDMLHVARYDDHEDTYLVSG